MYGDELLIANTSDRDINVRVRKREDQAALISGVQSDRNEIRWNSEPEHIVFEERLEPGRERHYQILYQEPDGAKTMDRTLGFELSVAARRVLSEFRDDYLSKSQFLSSTASTAEEHFHQGG